MSSQRQSLLDAAREFCEAFASREPIDEIVSHFSRSTTDPCSIFQHGHEHTAPFVGRKYQGIDGVKGYFSIVYEQLSFDEMKFTDFFADTETRQVSVEGEAFFVLVDNSECCWDEVFTYRMKFDEELKIKRLEIWGDTWTMNTAFSLVDEI